MSLMLSICRVKIKDTIERLVIKQVMVNETGDLPAGLEAPGPYNQCQDNN
jgi:hypothetical protein